MGRTYWLGEALSRKPGALHRQLGIAKDKAIPTSLLTRIIGAPPGNYVKNPTSRGRPMIRVTALMKRRANPVLTARGFRHRRRRGRIVY